jgi:hypothetical protein
LHAAAHRAVKGKRKKPSAASFFANLEGELLALERQLRTGEYQPGRYVAFEVNDPKKRIVSAAPFRDRVVHHALCTVVEPIFEAGFIDHKRPGPSMMSTVGAEGAPDTTAALVLAHSWGDRRRRFLHQFSGPKAADLPIMQPEI